MREHKENALKTYGDQRGLCEAFQLQGGRNGKDDKRELTEKALGLLAGYRRELQLAELMGK